MIEPEIVINGRLLSVGQSMTVRVAIQSFLMSLAETGCGNDDHGRKMTANYQRLCGEINDAMRLSENPKAIVHGVTCEKWRHDPQHGNYLHEESHDGPYDVDGVSYCGRCHHCLP